MSFAASALVLLGLAAPAPAAPECHAGETPREHAAHARADRSPTPRDHAQSAAPQRQRATGRRPPSRAARDRAARPAATCGVGEDPFASAPGSRD